MYTLEQAEVKGPIGGRLTRYSGIVLTGDCPCVLLFRLHSGEVVQGQVDVLARLALHDPG